MKDIVGSDCNEVGTPHLSSFELPRGTAFHGNTLFIHSLTCSWIRAKKIPWKNNEDFLIPTYLPTRLLHSYMIRDLDAHIFLATSRFEKSRGIFFVFFNTQYVPRMLMFVSNSIFYSFFLNNGDECEMKYPRRPPPHPQCFFIKLLFFWIYENVK